MRKNRTLTAAITTALSLSSWAVYGYDQFENVTTTHPTPADYRALQASISAGESTLIDSTKRPIPGFDFTSGETVIDVATTGVNFASELFGGSLTLPTVISGTGTHMAVVYTIDGTINQPFNVTFTLDKGATFAENPILGVRDKKGDGELVNAATIGALAMTLSSTSAGVASALSMGEVFRFDNQATIYKVDAAANPNFTFHQLGASATDGLTAAITASSKVYRQAGTVGIGTVRSAAVGAVTTNPWGVSTIPVSNAAAFTSGLKYICNSASASTSNTIFNVDTVNTTSNTISVSPVTSYSQYKTTTGLSECSTSPINIYRIHVPGDTVISLAASGASAGKLIQFDAQSPFYQTTKYAITAVDATKNTITISPGLTTILQNVEALYDVNITVGDTWTSSLGLPKTATASGKNVATFTLPANTPAPILATNDQIMLLYKLSNATALATPGEKVNMTVDLKTGGIKDVIVNPQRTVTVATSTKAMTVSLSSVDGGKVAIAVSSGNTQFSGSGEGLGAYISSTTAQIGQLKITDAGSTDTSPRMEDGVTSFSFSSGKVLANNSKLIITGGQFNASKASPGKVYLQATSSYDASFVTSDSAGEWSATWNLSSDNIKGIISALDGAAGLNTQANTAYIRIQADGTNTINTVENQPSAKFTLDFDNAAYKDIVVPLTDTVPLRKISQDGFSCTVYQIPPPSPGVMGADTMSIRVTNDSAVAGKIRGTLYDMDGKLLGTALTDLDSKELAAGATLRIESDKISTLFGGVTWTGRATLKITTILPQIEVMALVRQRNIPFAPLSNLSSGAKGTSCEQN